MMGLPRTATFCRRTQQVAKVQEVTTFPFMSGSSQSSLEEETIISRAAHTEPSPESLDPPNPKP